MTVAVPVGRHRQHHRNRQQLPPSPPTPTPHRARHPKPAGAPAPPSKNPYLFAGGTGSTQDRATGRIKNGARWYDPTQTTWTQQDTHNAPLDPTTANRYQYAGGDPINNTDPTGLWSWNDLAGSIYSGLVGCGAGIIAVDETGLGLAATAVFGPPVPLLPASEVAFAELLSLSVAGGH